MGVRLHFEQQGIDVACELLAGLEQAGVGGCFQATCFALEPIDGAVVLGARCAIIVELSASAVAFIGTVTRFTAIGTSRESKRRRYRLCIESSNCWGRWRRTCRVFQHLSVPDILREVSIGAGWDAQDLRFELTQSHPEREYVVQYEESDESFVRRLCEQEGLFFAPGTEDGRELLRFVDDSTALSPEDVTLGIVEPSELNTAGQFAWHVRRHRQRRVGRVALDDYSPQQPALDLGARSELGVDAEKTVEHYAAPGGYETPGDGKQRARQLLEQLRHDATVVEFETNAVWLRPGTAFSLASVGELGHGDAHDGGYVARSIRHGYTDRGERYEAHVTCVPAQAPLRLPSVTPQPSIAGLHSAVITGASGEEIHPDENGSVFVHFNWDRSGPTDHNSSLPVRVSQPNTPGSMTLPRVGWEVFVAFEDGDPGRPFVVGRAYNGKEMPPFPLPANKTVTAVRSFSSPGGGGMNSVHFDDAAGRQHLAINAAFGKATTVANNMSTQTAKVETLAIKGSQTRTVGANETVSVSDAHAVSAASQTASVGAMQSILVQGNLTVQTGTEVVLVGGALLEKVGSPVSGAINLAKAAAMQGASALGGVLGKAVGGSVGALVGGQLASAGGAMLQAAVDGKPVGAAGLSSIADGVLGMVPGAGAAIASIKGLGGKYPWEPDPPAKGSAAAGGGASNASEGGTAAGAAKGYRVEKVAGVMSETIGGALAVSSPGSVKWEATGAGLAAVGGSHVIKGKSYGLTVGGLNRETLGSSKLDIAGKTARTLKNGSDTSVSGNLKANSDAGYVLVSKAAIQIKASELTLDGSNVTFKCGGSVVSSSPGGLLIKASTIEIKGKTKQSGSTTH